MENFCPCCGVEYAEHEDGCIQVTNIFQFKDKKHNSIYKCKGDKKICYWCASILPCGIVDVVLGTKPAYM